MSPNANDEHRDQHDYRTLAPIENLKTRALMLQRLRRYFDDRGYVEVQTPVLSRDTIIDRHLDPICVPTIGVDTMDALPQHSSKSHLSMMWYLQTSPEQSMKRLLASGMNSIYQVGPVFRAAEYGQYHNPEFTMAEWYEVGAGLAEGLKTLDELLQSLLGTASASLKTFESAFNDATRLSLFDSSVERLAQWSVAEQLVDRTDWSNDWDDWVNLIFSMRVQPTLGFERPVLITHFPASQAALAKLSVDDPRTAERFEAFYRGVELANGYHELTDAELLYRRAVEANEQRIADGKSSLRVENRVIDAMRGGLPDSCGCALGFDRVVMLACGAERLDQVVAFTAERA